MQFSTVFALVALSVALPAPAPVDESAAARVTNTGAEASSAAVVADGPVAETSENLFVNGLGGFGFPGFGFNPFFGGFNPFFNPFGLGFGGLGGVVV